MTAHHNDWDTSSQRSESSSSVTSSSDPEIVALKAEMAEINKNLIKMLQTNQQNGCMLSLGTNLAAQPKPHAPEDVFIKVGKFHFPTNFVVVDFDADPRVPLILRRSFLKTRRALIDVYAGELTLRVGNKAVTFNLDQTSRYSSNYDDISVNRINVIDVACEEYSQEVLGFSVSGNPTPTSDPIDSTSSPTLTPFEDRDILLLEKFLNVDPSSPPLPPQELKVVEPKNEKSLIDEPPEGCPDFEASRARGFVLSSLELHILSFIMGIQYPNLID
ncbi:reverse transcriptase domain-containing protein [Tanacetum coccineum]